MLSKTLVMTAALLAFGCVTTTTAADAGTSSGSSAQSSITDQDRQFILKAASAGQTEVDSSRLALKKSGVGPAEKAFAQMMIDDHTKANERLTALATAKGVAIPKEPMAKDKRQLDELRDVDGATFDKRYATMQLAAHDEAIALFERASRDATDSELKQFATETLPTLRAHREHAAALPENAQAQPKANQGEKPTAGHVEAGKVPPGTK